MKLSQVENNKLVTIKSLEKSDFSSKFHEFGIIPGAKIKILNKALFNGPIYLEIDSSRIAIRNEEATFIEVE